MKLCNNTGEFREKFARVFKKSPANFLYSILIFRNERGRQLRRWSVSLWRLGVHFVLASQLQARQ
jgi:hypothetical protein